MSNPLMEKMLDFPEFSDITAVSYSHREVNTCTTEYVKYASP